MHGGWWTRGAQGIALGRGSSLTSDRGLQRRRAGQQPVLVRSAEVHRHRLSNQGKDLSAGSHATAEGPVPSRSMAVAMTALVVAVGGAGDYVVSATAVISNHGLSEAETIKCALVGAYGKAISGTTSSVTVPAGAANARLTLPITAVVSDVQAN